MSLILSLLRNYEPLPHTSEAELATGPSTIPRPYGYNYATRGNAYASQREGKREEGDGHEPESDERPGWSQGKRFRYDPPGSESYTATTSTRMTSAASPSSSFLSATNPLCSPTNLASDANGEKVSDPSRTSLSSPLPPLPPHSAPTNNLGLANLLAQGLSPAPASFFLSERNPALYPGLREKLKAKREKGRDKGTT
jgi:hypothetical protein